MKTTNHIVCRKNMETWSVKLVTEISHDVSQINKFLRQCKRDGYKVQSKYNGKGRMYREIVLVKE